MQCNEGCILRVMVILILPAAWLLCQLISVEIIKRLERVGKYLHKKEASTDVVGYWTHPDVSMFLQIFRRDYC